MRISAISAVALIAVLALSASSQPTTPKEVTIIANSIDLPYNAGTIDALKAANLQVTTITAADFQQHRNDSIILILGGHHAPEGMGEIVAGLLEASEKKELESNILAQAIRNYNNTWAQNQNVIVFAGHEKEQTGKAFAAAEPTLIQIINGNSSAPAYQAGQPADYGQLRNC
jgi:hypothetical protein